MPKKGLVFAVGNMIYATDEKELYFVKGRRGYLTGLTVLNENLYDSSLGTSDGYGTSGGMVCNTLTDSILVSEEGIKFLFVFQGKLHRVIYSRIYSNRQLVVRVESEITAVAAEENKFLVATKRGKEAKIFKMPANELIAKSDIPVSALAYYQGKAFSGNERGEIYELSENKLITKADSPITAMTSTEKYLCYGTKSGKIYKLVDNLIAERGGAIRDLTLEGDALYDGGRYVGLHKTNLKTGEHQLLFKGNIRLIELITTVEAPLLEEIFTVGRKIG